LSFNKETIYEYFIEYGPVIEVKLNSDKREAYILFETGNSVRKLFDRQDKNLFAMFRMKKYKMEKIPDNTMDDLRHIRTSFLDTNLINMMKNKQLKENEEFLSNKRQFSDVPLDKVHFEEQKPSMKKVEANKESKKLSLEELEKLVASKFAV